MSRSGSFADKSFQGIVTFGLLKILYPSLSSQRVFSWDPSLNDKQALGFGSKGRRNDHVLMSAYTYKKSVDDATEKNRILGQPPTANRQPLDFRLKTTD